MRLLHLHALRCLDDPDERVRVAACSACCRLLSRTVADVQSTNGRMRLTTSSTTTSLSASSQTQTQTQLPLKDASGGVISGKGFAYGREASPAATTTGMGSRSVGSSASSPRSMTPVMGGALALSVSEDEGTVGGLSLGIGIGTGTGVGVGVTASWVRSACKEVLERMLTVGLADEARCVRREVVMGLEVRFILGGGVAPGGYDSLRYRLRYAL